MLVYTARGGNLIGWRTKTWTQRWLAFNEGKMSEVPWHVEEGVQRLGEKGTLGWIYHVWLAHSAPNYVQQGHSQGTPFTKASRNTLERGAPASLKISLVFLLCRPGTTLKLHDSSGDRSATWFAGSSAKRKLRTPCSKIKNFKTVTVEFKLSVGPSEHGAPSHGTGHRPVKLGPAA